MILILFLVVAIDTKPHMNITCDDVRSIVAQYGKMGAIAHAKNIAKEHGYQITWQNIREAYKCIK